MIFMEPIDELGAPGSIPNRHLPCFSIQICKKTICNYRYATTVGMLPIPSIKWYWNRIMS